MPVGQDSDDSAAASDKDEAMKDLFSQAASAAPAPAAAPRSAKRGRSEDGYDATAIEELAITWPTSGTQQLFRDVPLDAFIHVVEGKGKYEVVELPVLSFGRKTGRKTESRKPKAETPSS